VIAETAQIAEDVVLEPGKFVDEDVMVGHGVRILSGAKVCAFVQIGDGTIIRENAVVLGGLGFSETRRECLFACPTSGESKQGAVLRSVHSRWFVLGPLTPPLSRLM